MTTEKKDDYIVDEKEAGLVYTREEERKLIRKLDLWILPILMVTNCLDYLDKAVFSSAALYGMVEDLGLVTIEGVDSEGNIITNNEKYSQATMIFFVGYIVGTYPWSVLAQKYRVSRVIAAACFIWSLIGILTPLCHNYPGVMVNRFFLGMAESAVSPIFSVYICYFWKRDEQVVRSAFWYAATGLGSVFGPIMGAGIGSIGGPLRSWKYMFFVIDGISLVWAAAIYFLLPDSPMGAKFLNEREKMIAMDRLRTSQTGAMEKKLNWGQFKECFSDHNVYFLVFYIFAASAPGSALTNFATLVVQGFGFTPFLTMCLMMPLGAVTVTGLAIASTVSRKFKGTRYYTMIVLLLIELAGALICWQSPTDNIAARYGGLCLFPFVVSATGMGVSLASSNIAGHTKKYVIGSAIFIANSLGSIVGTLVFGASPGPRFNAGFTGNTVFTVFCLVITIASRLRLSSINKSRDKRYGPEQDMDPNSVEGDLTDKQNKNFRYVL